MMVEIWYQFMKHYIKFAFYFYFKKIKIVGYQNIPKKGAIMFVCNHPNALLDPLLIKTHTYKDLYVLTRAGVFKNNFIIKIFESVKMIPIYRKRDGLNTISKNEAIFDRCYDILNDKKSILIFPEGSHSLLRKVRPLSKGFTRIIFGAFEKYPDLDIQIVPVGLNYDFPSKYPSAVSVYFGKPIIAKKHYNSDDLFSSINSLKDDVHGQMKKLTTHIEGDSKTYTKNLEKLKALNAVFLNPVETNKLLKNINDSDVSINKFNTTKKLKSLLYYLVLLNSLIPWIIWKKIKPKIKELEFTDTFRFAVGASLFPLTYIIQSFIIFAVFNKETALIYFLIAILSCFILAKTLKVND